MFNDQQKNSLKEIILQCYVSLATTVLVVGRENLKLLSATIGAESAFFVVVKTNVIECRSMVWCIVPNMGVFCIHSPWYMYHTTQAMVAVAGQSSDWSVSDNADILTPVTAITIERENSGDSMFIMLSEDATMATTPNPKHPKSAIPQLSYNCRRKIHRAQMVAFYTHTLYMGCDIEKVQLHVPYILSYIHDDIEDIDKELISLGLFDEAMGKNT